MGRGILKAAVSATAIALSYAIYVISTTGIRARTDEAFNLNGVVSAFRTGHLGLGYKSGSLYESLQTIILGVTGLSLWDTNWLSPVIAIFCFASIGLIAAAITKRSTGSVAWWVPVIVILGLVASPDIFAPLRETSHKSLTYTISIFLIFTVYLHVSDTKKDLRIFGLSLILPVSLVLSNYIWASIMISWICIGLWLLRDNLSSYTATIGAITLSSILYYPLLGWQQVLTRGVDVITSIRFFLQGTTTTNGGTSGDEGLLTLISTYPEITVFGVSISFFFLVSMGSFVMGILTGFAALLSLWLIWSSPKETELYFQHFLIVATVFYGILFILAAAAGVGVFAKRIVRPAVIIGAIGWVVVLSRDDIWAPLKTHRDQIVAVILILLVVSLPLSTVRTASDNTDKSVDYWAGSQELAGAEWINKYTVDEIDIASSSSMTRYISEKYYRNNVYTDRGKCFDPKIYSSTGPHSIDFYLIDYNPYDIKKEPSCPHPI